jgi:hypothetical protein
MSKACSEVRRIALMASDAPEEMNHVSIVACLRRERINDDGRVLDRVYSTPHNRRMRPSPYVALGSQSHQSHDESFTVFAIKGAEGCCEGLTFDKPKNFASDVWVSRAHFTSDVSTALLTANIEKWPMLNIAELTVDVISSDTEAFIRKMTADADRSSDPSDPETGFGMPLSSLSPWILVQAETPEAYKNYFDRATIWAIRESRRASERETVRARCNFVDDAEDGTRAHTFWLGKDRWVSFARGHGIITGWSHGEMRQIRVLPSY